MPVVYRCKVCGYIFHVFVRVGQSSYGLPTPSEIAAIYGDHCPRCGHRIEPPTLSDIVVKPNGREELLATLEEAPNAEYWLRVLREMGAVTLFTPRRHSNWNAERTRALGV